MVQFFHSSAVNPEKPLKIFGLDGSLPTSLGVTKLSRCPWIAGKSLSLIIYKSFHTSIMCLLVPNSRLCIGSIMHILGGLKYGNSFKTE